MASSTRTSSTEKLLHLIRGNTNHSSTGSRTGKAGAVPPVSRRTGRSGKKGSTVIGVDIAPDGLRLVRIERGAQGPRLIAYHSEPYGPDLGPDSAAFPSFLGRSIKTFKGNDKKAQIWSLVPTGQAELWHVRVPKVPRARLSETVYWAAMKEKTFDPDVMLMDYEVQGEIMEKGVPKILTLVSLVPHEALNRIKGLFAAAGVKLAGLTTPPMALQSLFRSELVSGCEEVCANVYIGRNWSRIDLFDKGDLSLSRGVNTGLSSLVSDLTETYNRRLDAAPTLPEPPAEPEAPAPMMELEYDFDLDHGETPEIELGDDATPEIELDFEFDAQTDATPEATPEADPEPEPVLSPLTEEQAQTLLLGKLLGRGVPADLPGAHLDVEAVLEHTGMALSRLVRQIERTLEHHRSALNGTPPSKIFFSGEICTSPLFLEFLANQLGLECVLLDPLGVLGSRTGAPGVPEAAARRLAYNLVCGLALNDEEISPNLLNTYKDKDKQQQILRQGNVVYGLFLVLVAIMAGLWFWRQGVKTELTAELDSNNTVLASFKPQVDEPLLLDMAARVGKQQHELKVLSQRYEGLAAIKELAQLTPDNVRLVSMQLDLGQPEAVTAEKDKGRRGRKADMEPTKVLVLDGVVTGAPGMFDATLATYLARLQNSPLFSTPVVHKRDVEPLGGNGDVLRFLLHINMS